MHTAPWLLTLVALAAGDDGFLPWRNDRHPTDAPKRHVQEIKAGSTEYSVNQGGTMDGRNCRSPQGVWQPFQQAWESNRRVRLENIGATDVIDPWLSTGSNDFRSLDEIVARAIEPGMTDKEKATALWWQQIQNRFHLEGDNTELSSPVKVLNVYGYNTCGNDSICLAGQWKMAGLKVAPARLVGHCVSQVYYDGGWHLFDGDMHSIYLLRDNETIAGEQDLVRDHDLIKRTHTQGILQPDRRSGDEWESSIYVFEGQVNGDRNADGKTAMSMTLRPNEAIEWRWGHAEPVKYHGTAAPKFPDRICNGLWEYRPDFSSQAWRQGASSVEGVREQNGELTAEPGKTGEVVWIMRTPYVFVGGRLETEGSGAKFEVSWDGKTWQDVGADFDKLFPSQGTAARYVYHLRCRLAGDARLRKLAIVNDLQMAPLSLPGMGIGTNAFRYTDRSPGERQVRVTHEWVERSASAPPAAPAKAVFPRDGGDSDGTDVVFRWEPATDPDGDGIADYHFELSARPDMKWPLSMSFAKLISRTADKGKPQYTLAAAGELNPDRPYYWRVRAQDSKGVWGAWSKTWSFTPRGPTPPRNVVLDYDSERRIGTLRWSANPLGRKPAAYRVYASDEKGFSVSDAPYKVTTGESKELPAEFPANFVAEVQGTELTVIGSEVGLPGANRCFYRVVAVDGSGKRSGPSDYSSAPRPVVVSAPIAKAQRGAEYRYPVAALRSLGDLRTRVVSGKEVMNYWDIERLRYRIEQGPAWLKIDEATGRLSGTPDAAGKAEVTVAVTLERPLRRLDEETLKWGIEKVLSSGTEAGGSATQSFVIEVAP